MFTAFVLTHIHLVVNPQRRHDRVTPQKAATPCGGIGVCHFKSDSELEDPSDSELEGPSATETSATASNGTNAANWVAIAKNATLQTRTVKLQGIDIPSEASSRGAYGYLLRTPPGGSPVVHAYLCCTDDDQRQERFFAAACSGESSSRTAYCTACANVRKGLYRPVTTARLPIDQAGHETYATRAKRGMQGADVADLGRRNKQLKTDMSALKEQVRRIMAELSDGAQGVRASEAVTMSRPVGRSTVEEVLDVMDEAAIHRDPLGNEILAGVLAKNPLMGHVWLCCINNMKSQLETGGKHGYRYWPRSTNSP